MFAGGRRLFEVLMLRFQSDYRLQLESDIQPEEV